MSFILHQASTAYLPSPLRTVILTDLSLTGRRHSGVETAQIITDMYRTQPNNLWLHTLRNLGNN